MNTNRAGNGGERSYMQSTSPIPDRSYRALLTVPSVSRVLAGMQIARIAQSMVSVAIVLFALTFYRSATLAGVATFFAIFPGLIVSPIAGALLDRYGRTRLVVLDYVIALGSLIFIGVLALLDLLPAWLLIVIASIASLTAPLSNTGLRSLFPLIVPKHLWERINAIDSMGYVVATIIGPPLAAGVLALWGGPVGFIFIGAAYGLAAAVIARSPDPPIPAKLSESLLADAWQGLIYTWRNPTLRGLGFSISLLNVGIGTLNIVAPLLVLDRLHLSETIVGFVFAVQGVAGMVSAALVGRSDSREREKLMLAVPMAGTGMVMALLLVHVNVIVLVLVMGIVGLLNGPLDVALFTIRQRRTHSSWTGRAFAVSMAFNYAGVPIGSALAGAVAAHSIRTAVGLGAMACLLSAIVALAMIPSSE